MPQPEFLRCSAGTLPPGTPAILREAYIQHADAMYPFLARRSVFLIARRGDRAVRIGAGTVILVGDTLLVATAAHLFEDVDPRETWVLPFDCNQEARVPVRDCGLDAAADVGWLELDRDRWQSMCQWLPARTADLRGGQTEIDDVVAVFGYPGELLRRPTREEPSNGIVPLCLLGGTVSVGRWPEHKLGTPPRLKVDLMMDYLPGGPLDGDPMLRQVPSPEGMSGGGVWDIRSKRPGVWAPDNAELIGIQTAWYRPQRLLRATQVQHWVACVRCDRPELSKGFRRARPRRA